MNEMMTGDHVLLERRLAVKPAIRREKIMKVFRLVLIAASVFVAWGCQSQWKVHGGADACRQMCENWGLEFAAMVGVGDQESSTGPGATACVCEPKGAGKAPSQATESGSAASVAGAQAAIIIAEQEAAQRQNNQNATSSYSR